MEKKEIDKLIELYVEGNIISEDKTKLMKLVKANPDLLNELEVRFDIARSIKYLGNEELKSKLANIHKEEYKTLESRNTSKFIKWIILTIAAISFLASGTYIYNMYFKTISNEEVYASYYDPYKASFYSRSNDEVNFSDIKTAYNEQKYNDVLSLVNVNTKVKDSELLLAVGVSAMEMGEFETAKMYFTQIIEAKDYFYIDHARWYKALVFIKENDMSSASILLKELSINPKANHNREANIILSKYE